MKRIVLSTVIVCLAMSWGFADVLVVDFTEPGSAHTSIFNNMQNANTGGESEDKLGLEYDYALYRWDMSALLGATINSATFSVRDTWWPAAFNTELRRIDTPLEWQQGDGTHDGTEWRWENDNGAGQYMVDWDENTATGHDWAGTAWTWFSSASDVRISAAVADFIDNQPIGGGTTSTFTITSLAQNWADGTWENRGLVLSATTAVSPGRASLTAPTVTIDYTMPIPEPASLALLAAGTASLSWLRRRRRR